MTEMDVRMLTNYVLQWVITDPDAGDTVMSRLQIAGPEAAEFDR